MVVSMLCTNGIQAQTTQTHLNQIQLMKQFLDTWKCEFGKDTIVISETKAFGNGGLEMYQKWLFKDEIMFEQKFIWGYDKKSDKYICAKVRNDNPEISLILFWFTSSNICERIPYEYISNPEQATSRAIYEFKSTDLMIVTFYNNNKLDRTFTWYKIRN
jgi:hypothetical protein